MARYGYRPGDREPEPTVKVADPTVYVYDERGGHRVHERVEPIVTPEVPTITPRVVRVSEPRERLGIDPIYDNDGLPYRTTPTGFRVRLVK